MLKLLILTLLSIFTLSYSFGQCPITQNSCMKEYCFCPELYDRLEIKYENDRKCYRCLPKCDILDCSLIYCYCAVGSKKTKINNCYKCVLDLYSISNDLII